MTSRWRLYLVALVFAGHASSVFAFSLLAYNVKGNGTTNWSTNALQVQAIGRQLTYLNPDIITFNEIPYTNTWQMTNWVKAYLPGYFLATDSGTDGFIRSVIASRFQIVRSQRWLARTNLSTFGYDGPYTRDLFEAEINMPGYSNSIHIFTTHLKAGTDAEDCQRRGAEAGAISNFFVHTFLPAHSNRLYLLAGDLNEDIARFPCAGQTIPRLTNSALGLRLTTPRNPYNNDERTISSTSPFRRYDYVLPCATLFSNIASSQVFRSDLLTPLPSGLNDNDSQIASDHLPVLMIFNNPADNIFPLLAAVTDDLFRITWKANLGLQYRVEGSIDLISWNPASSNLLATTTNISWTTNLSAPHQMYRVLRLP